MPGLDSDTLGLGQVESAESSHLTSCLKRFKQIIKLNIQWPFEVLAGIAQATYSHNPICSLFKSQIQIQAKDQAVHLTAAVSILLYMTPHGLEWHESR